MTKDLNIRKEPSGRYRAVLKSGRRYVAGKTFDHRRDAKVWLEAQQRALKDGIDIVSARRPVSSFLDEWMAYRVIAKAERTVITDRAMLRLLPPSIAALELGRVRPLDVINFVTYLTEQKRSQSTVTRAKATLSAFFDWCVKNKLIAANPAIGVEIPKQQSPRTEMLPFSADELEDVVDAISEYNPTLAEVTLICAWTGLRWSELREMRVRDFRSNGTPRLHVHRAAPEGVKVKTTKSSRSRIVPLTDRILHLVEKRARDRDPDDLLFVSGTGHQLHAAAFKRSTHWATTARGRRIHDLRHTAACLWLEDGVNPSTVQEWMGHHSMQVTDMYIRHLGPAADSSAISRLNAAGHARGTRRKGESQ